LLDLDAELDENHPTELTRKKDTNQAHTKTKTDEEEKKSDVSRHAQLHQRQSTKKLELKSFCDDIRAYNTWIACLHDTHSHSAEPSVFFYALYPKLCEYFKDTVQSTRYPTPNDLRPIFLRHGAVSNKYQNESSNTWLSMNKANFILFWLWFKDCCEIIKDLRYLWDPNLDANTSTQTAADAKAVNNDGNVGLNLFCPREVCENNLLQSIEGTFGLRLSSSMRGGLVLSYVENNYSDVHQKRGCKHVILIRQQQKAMYLCHKKVLSLHDIIRNFVKLKFLYTPNRPVPKEKLF